MLQLRICLKIYLLPALLVLVGQSSVAPDPCHPLMVLYHQLPSCWAVRGRSRETFFWQKTIGLVSPIFDFDKLGNVVTEEFIGGCLLRFG